MLARPAWKEARARLCPKSTGGAAGGTPRTRRCCWRVPGLPTERRCPAGRWMKRSTGSTAWIDDEAGRLARQLAQETDGTALLAYLNELKLRYYLVKLLRLVVFFSRATAVAGATRRAPATRAATTTTPPCSISWRAGTACGFASTGMVLCSASAYETLAGSDRAEAAADSPTPGGGGRRLSSRGWLRRGLGRGPRRRSMVCGSRLVLDGGLRRTGAPPLPCDVALRAVRRPHLAALAIRRRRTVELRRAARRPSTPGRHRGSTGRLQPASTSRRRYGTGCAASRRRTARGKRNC